MAPFSIRISHINTYHCLFLDNTKKLSGAKVAGTMSKWFNFNNRVIFRWDYKSTQHVIFKENETIPCSLCYVYCRQEIHFRIKYLKFQKSTCNGLTDDTAGTVLVNNAQNQLLRESNVVRRQ